METVRIDKWLWAARFFKTRSAATDAVLGGRVHLNDARVKPAKEVRAGDTIDLQDRTARMDARRAGRRRQARPGERGEDALRRDARFRRRPRAPIGGAEALSPARRRPRRTTDEAGPPPDRGSPPRRARRPQQTSLVVSPGSPDVVRRRKPSRARTQGAPMLRRTGATEERSPALCLQPREAWQDFARSAPICGGHSDASGTTPRSRRATCARSSAPARHQPDTRPGTSSTAVSFFGRPSRSPRNFIGFGVCVSVASPM